MNKKTLLITIGIVVVAVGVVGALFFQRLNNLSYELSSVKRGDIVQEASASGKVESPTKIDLRFKNSGKLVLLDAKVGERVTAGQLLAKQDTSQLNAQVLEMQAGIDVQKAKLDQLQAGVSPEDIIIAETAVVNAEMTVSNAEQSLDDARKNLVNKLQDAYTKADDAVRNKSDQLFNSPKTSSPQLIFILSDGQLESDVEWERMSIESTLKEWKDSLDIISKDGDLSLDLAVATKNINQVSSFLDKLALAVNSLTTNSSISQTNIDKWKTDISTARVNINTAVSNLYTAEENLNNKESAVRTADGNLKIAQNQLSIKKAPVRPSDIAVYQAQISQAEASLEKTLAQRDDLMLFAPSSGVVTGVNGEVGEIVGQDKVIVSFATGGALQIKLNVVEDVIVDVRVGQETRITFDAMGDQEFHGKVVAIDPAETIVGGAVYYQTTILFDKDDERVRSGMTANVWIKIAVSEDTLFIPESAIQYKDGVKIVQVLELDNVLDREIVTGIKNDIGMVEIISGISEGEQVLLSDKKIKK